MLDCRACEHEVDRTGLPVVCEMHADSAPISFSRIEMLLSEVEELASDNELRDRLLFAQVERIRSWKAGVYRA